MVIINYLVTATNLIMTNHLKWKKKKMKKMYTLLKCTWQVIKINECKQNQDNDDKLE